MSNRFVLLSRFPSFQPSRFPLPDGITIVGRASTCDFVIRNETVSRHHAEIIIDATSATVRDLGSFNGTFLDNERISMSPLKFGQRLQFGQVGFVVSSPDAYDFESDSTTDAPRPKAADELFARAIAAHAITLTPAQTRVLKMLLEGLSEKAVAGALEISHNTVHNHVREIYLACGVHSRPELLTLFLRRGGGAQKPSD
ncbi:MAG: FHA domain-containing protein [Planctomycetia bacterium]|nr:FHA domain-containing protein [Planctomycetia bacterium]